ncbi:hypothetical protein Trydic_g23319 [Trypoxylus dichotomus]
MNFVRATRHPQVRLFENRQEKSQLPIYGTAKRDGSLTYLPPNDAINYRGIESKSEGGNINPSSVEAYNNTLPQFEAITKLDLRQKCNNLMLVNMVRFVEVKKFEDVGNDFDVTHGL